MRDLFLLDPDVTFLNHGSFGACPRPVFEVYQAYQRELERQPVDFLGRRHDALLSEARAALATYLNAPPDDLIFIPNASVGANIVARSLPLRPGEDILATNHEYGAMDILWDYVCRKNGAIYRRQPIPLPITSARSVVEAIWSGVTPHTRLIFISHITSPTALILPVAEIVRRARHAGILTFIDGAHAAGQLPLNLGDLGADFYTGNCHKWLNAPKGAAFLYVRPEHQAMLEPDVISWGWREGASFAERHLWQGTRDICAYLAIPAALRFQAEHDWDMVRARCGLLARQMRLRFADITGQPSIAPDDGTWFAQMIASFLPPGTDGPSLKQRLYDQYNIEIPVTAWEGRWLIRASFQGYNTDADISRLVEAMLSLR